MDKNVKNNDKKITALYARTSTIMQASGLDAQIRALRRYCALHEITDYIIYEDDGISGAKVSRPALDRMMEDVKGEKIERVIVYSFSRYARSTSHLLKALETFKSLGVGFVSTTENLDTNTPLGVAIFSIISSISQLERDLIRERVINGLRAAKERGVKIGRKKTRPSALIRRLRSKGLTFREIARLANCSQGSVSVEMRQWEKEKAEGVEQNFEDGEISGELQDKIVNTPKVSADEVEIPPVPIQVIRY
jgi:DNA invertase Pin-like site-specific DNA recombinase